MQILLCKKIKTIIWKCFSKTENTMKRKKMIRHITDDLQIYSDDSNKEKIKTKYQDNAFFEGAILIMLVSELI